MMKTVKLQVTLETVTPLFLGGSDPRGKPELRAPSLRGVLRFWLRALLGGVLGDNPKEVFQRESQVFGSTEHASPVIVRMPHSLKIPSPVQLTQNRPGLAYLFFSARSFKNQPGRHAIPNGFKFTCTLQQRPGTPDPNTLPAAAAALWLLTHLGGLGMRARRGGGNLQVVTADWSDPSLPPLVPEAGTARKLQEALKNGLQQLREWAGKTFNGSLHPSFPNPPSFDILHPDWCDIAVVDREFNDWAEALDKFGQVMQSFRNRHDPDYKNIKAVLQSGGSVPPIKRAAFGLPIVFYFRSLNQRAILEGEEHDRRASPLIVRVTKLQNGKCVLVLTCFHSLLLPRGERLQLRRDGQKFPGVPPSEDLLSQFWNQLKQNLGPLLEVKGW